MEKAVEMKRMGKWFVGFFLFFCVMMWLIDKKLTTLDFEMGIFSATIATAITYFRNVSKEKEMDQRAEKYAKTNESPKSRAERGLPHDARTFHILNHLELETKRNELELTSLSDEEQKKTLGYLLDMYFQKQDLWTK